MISLIFSKDALLDLSQVSLEGADGRPFPMLVEWEYKPFYVPEHYLPSQLAHQWLQNSLPRNLSAAQVGFDLDKW